MRTTRADLAADLDALGLRPGDTVVLHASLRSLGQVQGGANSVIAALLDVLGPGGLLVMPTFTYDTAVFDPETTPAATGAIAEAARQWPGAVRSWHPTHSVAAIGAGAAELCSGHELVGGLSAGSPLDKAALRGGYVLLAGVSHTSNSTVHVGEARACAPYLDIPHSAEAPTRAKVATPAGEIEVVLRQPPGCSRAFGVIEAGLRAENAIADGTLGGALAQLMHGTAVAEKTRDMLRLDARAFLCNNPRCYRCSRGRQAMETDRKWGQLQ